MTLAYIVLITLAGGVLSVLIAAGLTVAVLGRLVRHLVSLSAGLLLGVAGRHGHRHDDGLQQDDGRAAEAAAERQLRLQARQQRHLHQRRQGRPADGEGAERGPRRRRLSSGRHSRLERLVCGREKYTVSFTWRARGIRAAL